HVQGGALLEWGERVDVLLGQVSEGGSAGSAGVSGGAQEHLSIVVDFPGDQCFREVQAPFGLVVGADLFDSQQGVAGLGADSAVQEASVAAQPCDSTGVVGATVHKFVADIGPAPDDELLDANQRENVTSGFVGVVNADGVAVE